MSVNERCSELVKLELSPERRGLLIYLLVVLLWSIVVYFTDENSMEKLNSMEGH